MTGTVLLLEDQESFRDLLGEYIESLGFTVVSCADKASATAALLASPPRMAVMDLYLPDGFSSDLLPEIYQVSPDCRVVFITGMARNDELKDLYTLNDEIVVLPKPFELDTLGRYLLFFDETIRGDQYYRDQGIPGGMSRARSQWMQRLQRLLRRR